ncbi:hypothetical protein G6F42_026009 [Rhizopus arrhizus]|nr:hypothetical protein G6F42_026009 [Rhizopus arrhizus]
MVPRKLRRRLISSRSGMLDSEVRAAFILASSDADELRTLLSLDASGLLGLLDMDSVGESVADVDGALGCSMLGCCDKGI